MASTEFIYDGAHSITFTDSSNVKKNTWTDWHLIPSSRPHMSPPGFSPNLVEIPGRGSPLDLTTYLTGKINYGQRSGSWEFIIFTGIEYWETVRKNITSFLHGKKLKVVLEDVPLRYYEGYFTVSILKSEENFTTLTINYAVDTNAYPVLKISDDWLWDPFNFETDYTNGQERVDIL